MVAGEVLGAIALAQARRLAEGIDGLATAPTRRPQAAPGGR